MKFRLKPGCSDGRTDRDPGGPQPARSARRPDLIRILFVQLIRSAIQFMGGRPDPLIEVGCRTGPDGVTLYIRDSGIGVDSRYQDLIFRPFQRLDEVPAPGGGHAAWGGRLRAA